MPRPKTIDDERLIALYADTPTAELAVLFGTSKGAVSQQAHKLGLRKSPAAVSAALRHTKSPETLAKFRAARLGHSVSDETRAKMRAAKEGKPLRADHRAALSVANLASPRVRRGENHPCWKGGARVEDRRSTDPVYREWRDAVLLRDDYTCAECHTKMPKKSRELHAHHIKEWAKYPDLRYVVSNGLAMCRDCHRALHGLAPIKREMVPCACGCGGVVPSKDNQGRPKHYLKNHSPKHRAAFSRRFKGRQRSAEHQEKISAAKRGVKRTAESRAKQAASMSVTMTEIWRRRREARDAGSSSE